jgi:hypothetical protein
MNVVIPFDAERMTVQPVKWASANPVGLPPGETVPARRVSGADELLEWELMSSGMELVFYGDRGFMQYFSKNIERDGEIINVVYFNYNDTRYNLLRNRFAPNNEPDKRTSGGGVSSFQLLNVEIYYMPYFKRSVWRGNYAWEIPDEIFDAQRHDAILVWKGVVGG